MCTSIATVSSAASPVMNDHLHRGHVAAHVRGNIVLYNQKGGVHYVDTNAKPFGQQSVFYFKAAHNIDPEDIRAALAQADVEVPEFIFYDHGAYVISTDLYHAAQIRQVLSGHAGLSVDEIPVLDLSESHGANIENTAKQVTVSWARPTRTFNITDLNEASDGTLRCMIASLPEEDLAFLGPTRTLFSTTTTFGQDMVYIVDAFETASEEELSEALFGTKNYDKTRFALGSIRSCPDTLEEQLNYVQDMLSYFGDLEMPVTTTIDMIDDHKVCAVATFETVEAATKATAQLQNSQLPFSYNSRLEICLFHESNIVFPTESSWERAASFCLSDELEELINDDGGHTTVTLDSNNLSIECMSDTRRGAIRMRRRLMQFVESPTPDTPTQTDSTDPRTCIICYDDECTSTVTGLCGDSYCIDCFTNCVGAGEWTRDGGIRCAATHNGTACSETLPLEIIANSVPRKLLTELLTKSLDAHVAKNPDVLQRCPDPDCTHLYEPAPKDGNPATRTCGDCGIFMCRACGKDHPQSDHCPLDYDEELQEALNELDARACPNCKVAIEKNEGCNHMTCPFCNIHICWQCMATFPEGHDVYTHMTAEHGRIGDGPEYLQVAADGAPIADEAMLAEQLEVEAQARGGNNNAVEEQNRETEGEGR